MSGLSVLDHEFTKYQVDLKKLILFELKSFIGRLVFNKKLQLPAGQINLLHLGSGTTKFDGWVNADFFRGFVPFKQYNNMPDWMVDLRYPLKCADNVWDGVFSEHTLEHLYPNQAFNLLGELKRTMKPGAWLRLSVPDLEKYVDYYKGTVRDERFRQWATGCEAIGFATQNYLHFSVWDAELLSVFLKKAGFGNVRQVGFLEGTDQRLLKESAERKWESLYIEAQNIDNCTKR